MIPAFVKFDAITCISVFVAPGLTIYTVATDKTNLAGIDGEMFGPGGEGFMRLNIAAPRSVLLHALEQLEAAIKTYTTGK